MILAAVAAFAATSVDDLLLVATFFAIGTTAARHVVVAQFAAIGVLYGISALLAVLALAMPADWLRWLGVVPVLLGLRQLARDVTADEQVPAGGPIAVFAVTVAGGGDKLGTCVPLFAVLSGREVALIGVVFAVMTGLWCALAARVARQPALELAVKRYGRRAAPFVLIGIGALILLEVL